MTMLHVGHVLFSSKCLTKQLLQTEKGKKLVNSEHIVRDNLFYLHVCKHSVTVVASIKYPLHILHVMWLFKVLSFILRSIIIIC